MAPPATQHPRWLTRPEPVRVRIERRVEGPFPEEVAVIIRINGETVYAIVPADAVTGDTVRGVKIAETDDRIFIAMPPSTITNPNLIVPKALQEEVFA